jgi:hypothetical protein
MKLIQTVSLLFIATFALSCSNSKKIIVPLDTNPSINDTYTIIWNGISKAYRYDGGTWKRADSYDYIFDVVQKRYGKTWKSIKNLHRLHPDYDGKAGPRSQSMYFEVHYNLRDNGLASSISSSLGSGDGTSDMEFRNQIIEIQLDDVSFFAPYSHIRITQKYKYEEGLLEETVLLYKQKGDTIIPFMKNEEKAYFFVQGTLDDAPTKWE